MMKEDFQLWITFEILWGNGILAPLRIMANYENLEIVTRKWIHNTNDEEIVLEKRVHEDSFRNCETLVQWVWSCYIDCFTNTKHFFLTGYI
jgi:hypothetical protein